MTLPAIGFAGVGMMGAGMASCLLSAGHPLCLLAHKNRAPIAALVAQGATEALDAVDLLRNCDVLITCLPNAEVIGAFGAELMPHFRQGQMWIDTSTSRPETSKQLSEQLAARGAFFVDAPLTGGPQQAHEGALVSLVGCDIAQFPAVNSIVSAYSKAVHRFGEPGSGHAAKLLNNLVTQGTTMLLADAFQCAAKLNVDAHALYDVMMAGAARSGTLEKAVGPALGGRFDAVRFTIANASKDLRYARDLIEQTAPTHAALAGLLAKRFDALASKGRGDSFVSTLFDPETP